MRFAKTLLTITFLSFSLLAFSQSNSSISGHVKDSTDVISGASVWIKNTKTGVITDTQGFYEITQLPPGNYLLQVSFLGFISTSRQVSLKANQKLSVDFSLKKDPHELSNISIVGKTKTQEIKESGFTVNALDVKKFSNLTSDLNQVLNRSVGVKVREQGGLGSTFNFSLNGLSGSQVRFFLDGIPMESFGGALTLNNIPVNLAERIEVYKGVVPVELGSDALGGAVNVITDQHTKKFLDASYSYGSFNTSRAALNGRYTDEKTGLMFNVSGFHNYSKNNYLMRNNPEYNAAISVVENGQIVEKDARRFHDAYRSSMGQLDIGVNHRSWADVFSIGFLYSNFYKQIQTGASQNNVRGALYQTGNFYMPSIKYKKSDFLIKGLSTNLTASLALDRNNVVDTSSYIYGWGGIIRPEALAGEISDVKTIYHYKNSTGIVRANFKYAIDDNQNLNLNYTYSRFSRSATEDIQSAKNNPFDKPNTIGKTVLGFAYQQDLLDKKLTNTVFAKYYRLATLVRRAIFLSNGVYSRKDSSNTGNNYGYGLASRYKLSNDLGLKFSYEHAFRLQEAEELFGDGINVISNISLKPERSDNINAGAYYTHISNRHKFSAEAGYFFRNAHNLIYSSPGGKYSTFINVNQVRINGIEAELGYQYANILEFSVNATYQSARDNQKLDPATGMKNVTYGDRVPNQPWLYGNANLSIGRDNLLGKQTRIQFNWSTHYSDWFYINWESRGSTESKNKIPSQLVHDVALSYSMEHGKYNISAESFNVTDALSYDNFRLQKPGRAIAIKLRYFIK